MRGMYGISLWLCAVGFASAAPVTKQTQQAEPQASNDVNKRLDELMACAGQYAHNYVKTQASPSDVVEAALSVCGKQLKAYSTAVNGAFPHPYSDQLFDIGVVTTKRAAMRVLLEFRYAPELLPPEFR